MKIKVLFICVHNSARSQMAEELLRKLGGDKYEVEDQAKGNNSILSLSYWQ